METSKGCKGGECATEGCNQIGAQSALVSSGLSIYVCQNCGTLLNDKLVGDGDTPDVIVRPNSR